MTDHLRYDVQDSIATLTLYRPDVRNALSPEMLDAMVEKLTAIQADDGIKVVVLTGHGDSFCAGGDIKAMKEAVEKKVQ